MVIYTIAIGRLWDIQTKCWEYIYFKGLRPKIHLKQTAKTGMVEYTCMSLYLSPENADTGRLLWQPGHPP